MPGRLGRLTEDSRQGYISPVRKDASPTEAEDMAGIILEGVLFVALLATMAALLFFVLRYWTPLGLRLRQVGNRKRLEQALELLVLLLLVPTAVTYVNPGHVGIVIHRTGGGVDPRALGPGLHMRNPLTTGIEEYPTFMQTLVLTRASSEGSRDNDEINVNSVEGQPLSLDVSM